MILLVVDGVSVGSLSVAYTRDQCERSTRLFRQAKRTPAVNLVDHRVGGTAHEVVLGWTTLKVARWMLGAVAT